MKSVFLLLLGVMVVASPSYAFSFFHKHQQPLSTADLQAILCQSKTNSAYNGQYLQNIGPQNSDVPQPQHMFNLGEGALVLRKDGRIDLYPNSQSDNFVELGQASVISFGTSTDVSHSKCQKFIIKVAPGVSYSESRSSVGGTYGCMSNGGAFPKPTICRDVTNTLSIHASRQAISSQCRIKQIYDSGWGDDQSDYQNPYGCAFAGNPQSGATARTEPNESATTPNDKLLQAARTNDLVLAQSALSSGADANIKNDEGTPTVVVAAAYGSDRVLNLLLDKDAQVNATSAFGNTAAMLAAFNDNASSLTMLARHGANLFARNSYTWTASEVAEKLGNIKSLKALLDSGASVFDEYISPSNEMGGATLILEAVVQQNLPMVTMLLAHHPNLETMGTWGGTGRHFTPLMWAAANGLNQIAATLLTAGANPNTATPQSNRTAYDYASDSTYATNGNAAGRREVIRDLILAGYNVNRVSDPNEPQYMLAALAAKGDVDLISLAIRHGAHVNAKGLLAGGTYYPGIPLHTALHYAIQFHQNAAAALLIKAGGVDE